MSYQHILLTTDLSDESRRAYAPVEELARVLGARITLLHVVHVLTKVPQGAMLAQPVELGNPEKEEREARAALSEHVELFRDSEVTVDVVHGENVARSVVDYAKKHDVGLIALSSHGRSGLRRLVLGSVAEAILRHANVPVLLYPPA